MLNFTKRHRLESPDESAAPTIESTLSATELAMGEFQRRVKEIAGITVTVHGGESLSEQFVIVEVPFLLSLEARRIVNLQGEMYRKYPRERACRTESTKSTPADDVLAISLPPAATVFRVTRQ